MAPLKLFVYIIGLGLSSFSVTIERSETVGDLKDAILKKSSNTLKDIDACQLTLYKVSAPDGKTLGQSVAQAPKDKLNVPSRKLSKIFQDDPPRKTVSILVELPDCFETTVPFKKRKSQEEVSLERYLETSPYVQETPSTVAQPAAFIEHQRSSEGRILNDRPDKDVRVTPIALLYPPFGRFLDHIQSPGCPRNSDGINLAKLEAAVDKFASALCQQYDDEDLRQVEIVEHLNHIFGCSLPPHPFARIARDVIGTRISGGHAYGPAHTVEIIVQAKSGTGSTKTDPEVQLTAYYLQSHAHNRKYGNYKSLYGTRFLFPALGISIVGSYIGFSALVLLDQPRFVRLTPLLLTHFSSGYNSARLALFQVFWAACVLRSDIYNDTLQAVHHPPSEPLRGRNLPQIQSMPAWPSNSGTGEQLEFSIQEVTGQNPMSWNDKRFLYLAKMQDKEVMVKFTHRYCPEFHHFCAERGHAPKLFGYGTVPGGWHVVVMEYIAKQLYPLEDYASTYWTRWERDLTKLMVDFHKEGFVHGDLRSANFVVSPKQPEKILLVGYDWAGEPGVACFPTRLLNEELIEGKEVKDLLITKEHDIRVLRATFDKLKPCGGQVMDGTV